MVYQIPPEPAHFVDRDEEQARVLRAVAQAQESQERRSGARPLCFALSGYGGTGKSELAFRLARGVAERYPDGVLYVDLDDVRRADGGVDIADVLGDLLRALGSDWIAPVFKERVRQYWSLTHGKRLVLVIDNARFGTEVEPLLPTSGASLAIVTSHGPLYDLQAGAAVELPLDPLGEAHARELLERVTRDGDERLAAEPDQTRRLLRLCAGLPAALHVAGRLLRRHPQRPLPRLLGSLTAELHEKGIPTVERVWDAAYGGLSGEAARLYRLLADFPGPSFTPAAAAALLGGDAEDALDELREAGLLDHRSGEDGRARLPELLRAHARRRAEADGDENERDAARRRIVRWYLRQAQRADLLAAGRRLTLAAVVPPVPGTLDVLFERPGDEPGPEKRRAYQWLEAERHALFACVRIAHAAGAEGTWGTEEAWALCEPLWTHFLDHPHYADHIEAFRTGVAAAQRAGHIRAVVRMRCQLARPLWEQGELEAADRELGQALRAVEAALGDSADERKLAASAMEFRGMLRAAQGDWAAAAAEFEASRAVHAGIGNAYGVTLQTYRLGEALAHLGELERAAELLTGAREEFAADGRIRLVARAEFALGGVLARLGRADEARERYLAALAGARGRGGARDEIRVLDALAELAAGEGREAEAEEHRAAARSVRERCGLE
ncbi:ATP-binding protein [Streptomyces sp. NPDC050619]|uniref:ATP-binding protein n=1 Tax=Streptomyces sp. NPDC050619 TaxID=3157214 RepID=UPI0034420933